MRGENLERAKLAWAALALGEAALLPAWERYSGVVWSYLDPGALGEEELARVLIPSGAYGVTNGLDVIADYRLKMSVRLLGIGGVGGWWKDRTTAAVEERVGEGRVINLLPREHRAALELAGKLDVVDVVFVDNGRSSGHGAKAVKGKVARQVLLNGWESLESFSWEGWEGELGEKSCVVRKVD